MSTGFAAIIKEVQKLSREEKSLNCVHSPQYTSSKRVEKNYTKAIRIQRSPFREVS